MKKNSKIILTALSFSLMLAIASCDSKNESNTNPADQAQTTVTTPAVTEVSTTDIETSSSSEVTELPGEEIDMDSLTYDFKDLDTGEMVQAFTDGKYMISYYIKNYEDTIQTMYFDSDKALIHINSQGIEYDIVYKNGKKINIYKDSKYTEDSMANAQDLNIFGHFGYIGSGKAELDGKDYKYEEYYDKSGRLRTKLFVDDDGKIVAFEEAGTVLYIVDYSSEFDGDKIITVPENCEELSEEKFTLLMYDLFNKAAGTDQTTQATDESNTNN